MTGLSEKIRSANFVGMSMLLHSSAILAIAMGPMYFPEMMGNNTEADMDTIEFTVLEDTSPAPQVQSLAMVAPPKAAPAPVIEAKPEPAPEVIQQEVSKSNEMPEKELAAEVQKEEFRELPAAEPEAEQPMEALTDDSEVIAAQEKQKQMEQERQALEEKLAAVEAARKAEQAEIELLKQEQERLAQEKAEAQALAAQSEAARLEQEQQAAEAAATAVAAQEAAAAEKAQAEQAMAAAKAQADAQAAAAAEKLAAAQKAAAESKKGQGAGAGEKIVVQQDVLSLLQMPGNKPPKYSTSMRLKKLEGRGQLVYFVDKSGNVSQMRMTRSTGSTELDNEAIRAFQEYKFRPGQEGYTVHNFQFKLEGPAKASDGRLRAKN